MIKEIIEELKRRLLAPPDPDEPPGRLQSFARAVKYALYVAVPVAVLILYQWMADLLLAAPGEVLLIWIVAALVVSFVFRAPGFHAMALLASAVVLFYPAHLIFVNSHAIPVLYLVVTVLSVWFQVHKGRSWPRIAYTQILIILLFIVLGEVMGPVFSSGHHGDSVRNKGVRKIDGPALDQETHKTIDLTGMNAMKIMVSTNGKRLYASYERDQSVAGVAAFALSDSEQSLFRPLGGMGARLMQIHQKTGDLYASSLSNGTLYRLKYKDLSIAEEHRLSPVPFPAAVIDTPGNQVFVADDVDHAIKVFSLNNTKKTWAKIPSGDFRFKIKPRQGENLLPGTRSLSAMTLDPVRRRIFITYAMSRNFVVLDMDEYRVMKIDRGPYPWAASVAIDPGRGTLFLAKPLGFIEFYKTDTLSMRLRLARHGGFRALAYDARADRLVAANYYSGFVHFMDPSTGRLIARRHVCLRITDIAVSPVNSNVYVTCEGGIYELDPKAAGVPDTAPAQ
jgi:DNA-binding beta-propeller fold protein YncE